MPGSFLEITRSKDKEEEWRIYMLTLQGPSESKKLRLARESKGVFKKWVSSNLRKICIASVQGLKVTSKYSVDCEKGVLGGKVPSVALLRWNGWFHFIISKLGILFAEIDLKFLLLLASATGKTTSNIKSSFLQAKNCHTQPFLQNSKEGCPTEKKKFRYFCNQWGKQNQSFQNI